MNATSWKCTVLAGFIARRSNCWTHLTTFTNCRQLYPLAACNSLDVRHFRNLLHDERKRVWSTAGSRLLAPATFAQSSSQHKKDGNGEHATIKKAAEQAPELTVEEEMQKLGLFARFKKMYKEYWYVLLPAHLVTSAVWFGSFYYVSKR